MGKLHQCYLRMLCVETRVENVSLHLMNRLTLQFIQQTLQKVIYILNADKNWNNGICI